MNPEAIMAYHARSFAPAARLLSRPDRLLIARLYALCRTIDDIADEIGGPIGHDRLQTLYDDLGRSDPRDSLAIEAATWVGCFDRIGADCGDRYGSDLYRR